MADAAIDDRYDLERFIVAQRRNYACALTELRAGRKRGHWMWFVFPQIAGLGESYMASRFAIRSRNEAAAYLAHSVLRPRLVACVTALQGLPVTDAVAVFGPIDGMKLRSSLTLFAAAGGPAILDAALDRWFAGARDPATLARLGNTD